MKINMNPLRLTFLTMVLAVEIISHQPVFAGIDDGLIAYYSFDGVDPGLDCSGNGKDLSLAGATELGSGKRGDGLVFLEQNDAECSAFANYDWGSNLTVSLWFNWAGGAEAKGVVIYAGGAKNVSWQIALTTTEYGAGVVIGMNTENLNMFTQNFPTLPIKEKTWNHLALVYNGSEAELIWNGSKIPANVPNKGKILDFDSALVIGGQFRGIMDEIRIYDRALSEDEIRQLRRDEPGKPPSECIRRLVETVLATNVQEVAISAEDREAAQLEALSCEVLDRWVEMLRREARAELEEAFTRTSRRSLMWDALVQLNDPAKALPESEIAKRKNPSEDGPCLASVMKILQTWKKGEKFFAFTELEKLLAKKLEWESKSANPK